MSNTSIKWSIPPLILRTGSPERIRLNEKLFRTVYRRESSKQVVDAEKKPIHTPDQTFKSFDSKSPPLSPAPSPQSAPTSPNLSEEIDPALAERRSCMIAQQAKRKCAKRLHEATQKTFEIARPDHFVTWTAEIKDKMKNALYRFVKSI